MYLVLACLAAQAGFMYLLVWLPKPESINHRIGGKYNVRGLVRFDRVQYRRIWRTLRDKWWPSLNYKVCMFVKIKIAE
jgi:hypothetical protein